MPIGAGADISDLGSVGDLLGEVLTPLGDAMLQAVAGMTAGMGGMPILMEMSEGLQDGALEVVRSALS